MHNADWLQSRYNPGLSKINWAAHTLLKATLFCIIQLKIFIIAILHSTAFVIWWILAFILGHFCSPAGQLAGGGRGAVSWVGDLVLANSADSQTEY